MKLLSGIPRDPGARTSDDQEFLMDTEDIVENWRREAIREGREFGIADSLIDAYETRFGAIPPELRAVIERTHDEATLRAWHKLAITRSAAEIAAALRASRAS
jgi:hypothetical protein